MKKRRAKKKKEIVKELKAGGGKTFSVFFFFNWGVGKEVKHSFKIPDLLDNKLIVEDSPTPTEK